MALASATEITQALSTTGWGFVSLHTATPGTTGASEVTGGTYARVAVTWTASTGGSAASNSGALSINLPASTTATHFGIWSTGGTSGGQYYIGGALSPSVTTSTSAGVVTIAAAALTVSAS
jgi:hypothetical protein